VFLSKLPPESPTLLPSHTLDLYSLWHNHTHTLPPSLPPSFPPALPHLPKQQHPLPGPSNPLEVIRHPQRQHHRLLQQLLRLRQISNRLPRDIHPLFHNLPLNTLNQLRIRPPRLPRHVAITRFPIRRQRRRVSLSSSTTTAAAAAVALVQSSVRARGIEGRRVAASAASAAAPSLVSSSILGGGGGGGGGGGRVGGQGGLDRGTDTAAVSPG